WGAYVEDNQEWLPHAYPSNPHSYEWLPEDNDTHRLDNPDTTVKQSPLWPYCPVLDVWRCPANEAKVWNWTVQEYRPAIHSMVMNAFTGGGLGDSGGIAINGTWYHKTSDFLSMGASILFVFMDNRSDQYFQTIEVWMLGWPDQPQDYWLPY